MLIKLQLFIKVLNRYKARYKYDPKLKALSNFEPKSTDEQSFKCACYWESYWCHLLLGHFPQAAAEAEKLIIHSTWSPAVFTYLRAIALVSEIQGALNLV